MAARMLGPSSNCALWLFAVCVAAKATTMSCVPAPETIVVDRGSFVAEPVQIDEVM